jgi:hypothetical protein
MPSQELPLIDNGLDELLTGVDHQQCAHLMRAFDIMAERLPGVTNSTALWAIASLLAKIMAAASLDPDILDATGQRFSNMLRTAYPAQVRAMEEMRRQQDGRQRYDA